MNRLPEGQIVVGTGIDLTLDEVLALEIEMIELGHLFETDYLEHTPKGYQVTYENINYDLMESSNTPQNQAPSTSSNTHAQTYASQRQYQIGQPPNNTNNTPISNIFRNHMLIMDISPYILSAFIVSLVFMLFFLYCLLLLHVLSLVQETLVRLKKYL